MVKQTAAVSEAITPQTILHRFNLYNDHIERIRKANLESGLDVKRNNNFVSQNKLTKQGVYEEFIQKTVNTKTGKWYTIESLTAAGVQFNYTIYALTKEGNAIHRTISDTDFYYRPQVEYRYVPEDVNNHDGKQIHVGIVNDAGWGREPTNGVKVQLIPYSKEKISSMLVVIPPIGPYADRYNGCGLSLIREGESNKAISVTSLDELTADFDFIWDKYRGRNANAKVDVKELVTELQRQSITSGEHTQYG